jgi:peptide chain release factor 2
LNEKKRKLNKLRLGFKKKNVWKDFAYNERVLKGRKKLQDTINNIKKIYKCIKEYNELFSIVSSEEEDLTSAIISQVNKLDVSLKRTEFIKLFNHQMAKKDAFIDIKSGSGGTESQDWASMLMRMYLKFAEIHGFKTNIMNISYGEKIGIKSCSMNFQGRFAYGWLRTESGIHRLVRKSPFDIGKRRHTSFASVFISPDVNNKSNISINSNEIRIDTYRASGAGGQHVNRTDSAVRITHIPTDIVVQCQSNRSQHKNKASAMEQLKAKLYKLEEEKKNVKKNALENSKSRIAWGSQIRSYILDQSKIKDLRTGLIKTNVQDIFNGELDLFIKASLALGL